MAVTTSTAAERRVFRGVQIVTNAHVVEEVLRTGWPENKSVIFGCDFHRFAIDHGGIFTPLTDQYEIHQSFDLALLFLRRESSVGNSVKSLAIASREPDKALELRIGVIGHPAFDSRRDPFPHFSVLGVNLGQSGSREEGAELAGVPRRAGNFHERDREVRECRAARRMVR